jgi:hypothetical protein
LVQHLHTGEARKEVERLSGSFNALRGRVKHGLAQAMKGQVPFRMIEAEAFEPAVEGAKPILDGRKFNSSNRPVRVGRE